MMAADRKKPFYLPVFDSFDVLLLHTNDKFRKECQKAKTAEDQMEFLIHRLISHIESNPLESSSRTIEAFKSESTSVTLRKEGNNRCSKWDYKHAVVSYTHSIAAAPKDSNALALAFANRSSVLREMGMFADCISDIQSALAHGYPELLQFQLLIREGQCHRDLNQSESAAQSFFRAEELVKKTFPSETRKVQALESIANERVKRPRAAFGRVICVPEAPALSYGRSEEVPMTSSAVAIQYSQEFGRQLSATRDIKIGDVLLVEEPFAVVLDKAFWYTHCTHCLRRCNTLLPCNTCAWAMFCSHECRDQAMQSYHAVECAVVIQMYSGSIEPCCCYITVMMAVRIIATVGLDQMISSLYKPAAHPDLDDSEARRTKGFNAQGRYLPGFETLYSLSFNVKQPVERMVNECMDALWILKLFNVQLNAPFIPALATLVYKTIRIFTSNGYKPFDMEIGKRPLYKNVVCNQIGLGLYLTAALINHSCLPNAFSSHHGRARALRALQDIQKGSQIFESYGPHWNDSFKERQSILLEKCNFVCKCEVCTDWPKVVTRFPVLPKYNKRERRIKLELDPIFPIIGARVADEDLLDESNIQLFQNYLRTIFKHKKYYNLTFLLMEHFIDYYYCSHQGNVYYS